MATKLAAKSTHSGLYRSLWCITFWKYNVHEVQFGEKTVNKIISTYKAITHKNA